MQTQHETKAPTYAIAKKPITEDVNPSFLRFFGGAARLAREGLAFMFFNVFGDDITDI